MATSNLSSIRRQVKNVAYNYSETQVKVREATSNDPWGPSSSLMSEIADLTNNTVAFTEIMQMIWKRLNDKNKNWRHVYKSLVLLDYLVKCGSERVAQQCKENIFSVETLKSFQHIEDNKDQGHNIRQKATHIVSLLKDDEKLRNERARAIMARKRFVQNSVGISSDGSTTRAYGGSSSSAARGDDPGDPDGILEARPTSVGEEEMQLQIALALSREEAAREEEARKGDEIRLQMALQESKHDKAQPATNGYNGQGTSSSSSVPHGSGGSAIDDLLSLGPALGPIPSNDPWMATSSAAPIFGSANDPWSPQGQAAPPLPKTVPNADPWSPLTQNAPVLPQPAMAMNDPWAPTSNGEQMNPTGPAGLTSGTMHNSTSMDMWADMSSSLNSTSIITPSPAQQPIKPRTDLQEKRLQSKTPETFLGANSSLVNLDELLGPSVTKQGGSGQHQMNNAQNRSASANPFMAASAGGPSGGLSYSNNTAASSILAQSANNNSNQLINPFAAAQRPSPSLNQMRAQNSLALGAEASNMGGMGGSNSADWSSPLPQPLQPQPAATNPFL